MGMADEPRSSSDTDSAAMPCSYKGKGGIARLLGATRNSLNGLKAACKHEAAFRQELAVSLVLAVASIWIAPSFLFGVLMNACLLFVLAVELLNSAIEALADAVSVRHNELLGRAKDLGSAAVLASILSTLVVWGAAIHLRFLS